MNLSEARSLYSGADELERVTRLIRERLAAIEAAKPGCFDYEGASLRGTIEREIYQEATRGADVLRLLEPSASDGRPLVTALKARARLAAQSLRKTRVAHDMAGAPFVFCTIDKRFVPFFEPFMREIGVEHCALLGLGAEGIEAASASRGIRVLQRVRGRPRLTALGRPPRALFPFYASAVAMHADAKAALEAWRPTTLVFGEGASPQEHALGRAARAAGIPTVRVQHGRGGVMHPGYYDMPYDKMLMWGEGFAERIRPYSPRARYVVTGSPLFDAAVKGGAAPALKAFAAAGPVVTMISQPISSNISKADYGALVETAERLLQASTAVQVLVRLHPADRAADFRELGARWPARVLVTQAADHSLRSVFEVSTLVAGLFSTTLSEAAAFGVLPVVLRLGARHRIFPAPEEEGAAVLAESAAAAASALAALLANAERRAAYAQGMRSFASKYFGACDGSALARIAHHIRHPQA